MSNTKNIVPKISAYKGLNKLNIKRVIAVKLTDAIQRHNNSKISIVFRSLVFSNTLGEDIIEYEYLWINYREH